MNNEVFSLLLKVYFGLLLISMFFNCSKSTNSEISFSSEDYPENEILVDGMPEKVAEMKQKGVEVYKNEKGYWEADFGNLLVWVYVPAGQFPMGSDIGEPDELPIHVVYLDGYWINKYQTTVAQLREFVEDTGYITEAEKGMGSWQYVGGNPKDQDQWEPVPDGNWKNTYFEQGDDHPVVSVSWIDGYNLIFLSICLQKHNGKKLQEGETDAHIRGDLKTPMERGQIMLMLIFSINMVMLVSRIRQLMMDIPKHLLPKLFLLVSLPMVCLI